MKWYNNNLKLILATLFATPLGVYGLYKRPTKKRGLKIILLILGTIYSSIYLFIIVALIAFIFTGKHKLKYDSAVLKMDEKKYEQALIDFKEIRRESEYYPEAQKRMAVIYKKLDSIKAFELEIFSIQEKQRKDIEKHKTIWSDSIVKSWKGEFIVDYKKTHRW